MGARLVRRHEHGSRRLRVTTLVALAAALTPLACSNHGGDLSLCPRYQQLLRAEAVVRTVDAKSMSAADATRVLEAYLGRVRQVRQVADGRYGDALYTFERRPPRRVGFDSVRGRTSSSASSSSVPTRPRC